jgi:hypothetical protein
MKRNNLRQAFPLLSRSKEKKSKRQTPLIGAAHRVDTEIPIKRGKRMEEHICLSCGKPDPEGLKILGNCFCADCEAGMVQSNLENDSYQHWIDICRQIWEKFIPALTKTE